MIKIGLPREMDRVHFVLSHVAVGDYVSKGDKVVRVSTADGKKYDLNASEAGRVMEILPSAGHLMKGGDTIFVLADGPEKATMAPMKARRGLMEWWPAFGTIFVAVAIVSHLLRLAIQKGYVVVPVLNEAQQSIVTWAEHSNLQSMVWSLDQWAWMALADGLLYVFGVGFIVFLLHRRTAFGDRFFILIALAFIYFPVLIVLPSTGVGALWSNGVAFLVGSGGEERAERQREHLAQVKAALGVVAISEDLPADKRRALDEAYTDAVSAAADTDNLDDLETLVEEQLRLLGRD